MTEKSKSKRVAKKAVAQPTPVVEVQEIAADCIVPGANHRQHFDPIALKELADSIREHGLAQPITVRPLPTGGYQIVAGERRYRAMSHILQWERIPCLVKEMSDEQAEVIMGIENLQREDLLPMEEAEIYKRQVDKGKSAREIAKTFGVSDTKVRSRLALLDLLPEFQRLVNQGALPLAHAERMAELDQITHPRPLAEVLEFDRSKWDPTVAVNLTAAFEMSHEVGDRIHRPGGSGRGGDGDDIESPIDERLGQSVQESRLADPLLPADDEGPWTICEQLQLGLTGHETERERTGSRRSRRRHIDDPTHDVPF
jgi:ParB/RepB/Spo0J family partition protein